MSLGVARGVWRVPKKDRYESPQISGTHREFLSIYARLDSYAVADVTLQHLTFQ